MKRSLKSAIIRPFVFALVMVLAIFIVLGQLDYNWVATNQGGKVVEGIVTQTQLAIGDFFKEPLNVNRVLVSAVEVGAYYQEETLAPVEALFKSVYQDLYKEVPQVSVISYGDEGSRYIGIRDNDSKGDFSLMLSDKRTEGVLKIFSGVEMTTEVLGAFEGYDPRVRPWYAPVLSRPVPQWTDIYINVDEKEEMTLSTSMPFMGQNKQMQGVICLDVKLSGIQRFLSENPSVGTGVIFIVNQSEEVIAFSTDESNIQEGALLPVLQSERLIVTEAYTLLKSAPNPSDVLRFKIGQKNHFATMVPLISPEDLGWHIVVVIPEEDILGNLKNRQWVTSLGLMLFVLLGTLVGSYALTKAISPILESTHAAWELSRGNWESGLNVSKSHLKETQELVDAFNGMVVNLKNSFNQIQEKEERYRVLVENVDDLIYSFDRSGKLLAVNESFEKQFGCTRDKAIGSNLFTLLDAVKKDHSLRGQFDEMMDAPHKMRFLFEVLTDESERVVLKMTWIPVLSALGQVHSVLGTGVNITPLIEAQENLHTLFTSERKRLEHLVTEKNEALSLALRELIEKEKLASLGSLVSGVSHEINTPLGVAVSAASYLESINSKVIQSLETGELTKSSLLSYFEKIEETANILNTNLSRAAMLIKSFKSIAVDQQLDERTNIALKAYIETILLSLKHEYKNKGHIIEVDCPADLVIKTYPGAISQILTNLVMNSLTHGFEGSTGGLIKISFFQEGKQLKWVYADNGLGMTEEILSKMYDPFFTTNRGGGGSGLGLNVIYNLVVGTLSGNIECTSALGEGTTFTITFDVSEE